MFKHITPVSASALHLWPCFAEQETSHKTQPKVSMQTGPRLHSRRSLSLGQSPPSSYAVKLRATSSASLSHARTSWGYMQRADYYSVLGIDVPEDFKRHDTSTRLLPVSKIPINELEAEPNRIAGQLKTMILSHLRLSESVSDNMDLALGEIIDNVVQHSGASAPGVACAQYYPSEAYIEICVADCGVGIPVSMAENPDYAGFSDADLLAMAFEQKTGQWYGRSHTGTNKVSGGMGLSYASHLVRAIGGHIWAISHSTAVHLSCAGTEELKGLFYPGTLIVMRVPETLDEVSEIEMYGEGSDSPSLWNDVDGRHSVDSGELW